MSPEGTRTEFPEEVDVDRLRTIEVAALADGSFGLAEETWAVEEHRAGRG